MVVERCSHGTGPKRSRLAQNVYCILLLNEYVLGKGLNPGSRGHDSIHDDMNMSAMIT